MHEFQELEQPVHEIPTALWKKESHPNQRGYFTLWNLVTVVKHFRKGKISGCMYCVSGNFKEVAYGAAELV